VHLDADAEPGARQHPWPGLPSARCRCRMGLKATLPHLAMNTHRTRQHISPAKAVSQRPLPRRFCLPPAQSGRSLLLQAAMSQNTVPIRNDTSHRNLVLCSRSSVLRPLQGIRAILSTVLTTSWAKRFSSIAVYPPRPSTLRKILAPRSQARRIHCFNVSVTAPNASGPRQFPMRTLRPASVGGFWH